MIFHKNPLTIGSKHDVRITAEDGIDTALAVESKAFRDWVARWDHALICCAIHLQSMDVRKGRALFLKFAAEVTDAEGNPLPEIVFMRGGCVSILCILVDETTGIEYAAFVRQARVPIGRSSFPENAAGMMDDVNDPSAVAVLELEQELGIKATADELVDLFAFAFGDQFPGLYISPGGSDEYLRPFLYRKIVPSNTILRMEGKLTGERHEREFITVNIVPYANLWRVIPNASAHAAMKLYDEYRKVA